MMLMRSGSKLGSGRLRRKRSGPMGIPFCSIGFTNECAVQGTYFPSLITPPPTLHCFLKRAALPILFSRPRQTSRERLKETQQYLLPGMLLPVQEECLSLLLAITMIPLDSLS